jgi:radical SAM superfamily enzyme YgiQ (UPF0313 family)
MRRTRPPVVGIAALATIRRNALTLAEIAHRHGAAVILGGPDPTASPERYLLHRSGDGKFPVDAVVFKEGELTTVEVVDQLLAQGKASQTLRDIPGLRLRGEGDQVIATAPREFIDDLDSLPFPARDLVDLDAYRTAWQKAHGHWSLSIIHSRGCPYACTWCQKAVFGRTYRSRSPENAAQEMRQIKAAYGPDQVRVVDDVSGLSEVWVSEWRDALVARDAVIPFECLSRANLLNKGLVLALKEAGCRKVFLGAESGAQSVLDAMNKETSVPQIYRAAALCRRAAIKTHFYMMVGYPGEEWGDIRRSVKLLRVARPNEFSTTIAYPLPGTEFYDQIREQMSPDGCWGWDWTHTAENRLLFRRGQYSTLFYRWVIRWFRVEWKDAWLRAGRRASPFERVRTWAGLWLCRAVVHLLAWVSSGSGFRFHLAEEAQSA